MLPHLQSLNPRKVFAIVLVFIGGLVWLGMGRAASSFSFAGSSTQATGYALALFSALWTYEGWDQACYVTKDIAPGTLPFVLPFRSHSPHPLTCSRRRTIINSSMGLVVSLFLSANISYFLVLPFATATASSTIGSSLLPASLSHADASPAGLDFGREIAGSVGGFIFALIVGLSCLGALNGSLYTSRRALPILHRSAELIQPPQSPDRRSGRARLPPEAVLQVQRTPVNADQWDPSLLLPLRPLHPPGRFYSLDAVLRRGFVSSRSLRTLITLNRFARGPGTFLWW